MKAFKFILAGGVAASALVGAAPAAAQYYPGYGYPNNGNVVGQVINQVLGGGGYRGGYGYNGYGYGVNSQVVVDQCARAVEARIARNYAPYGYNPYGYNSYGAGGRVLGVTSIEPRSSGALRVRGVASSNPQRAGYGGYGGYGYAQPVADLSFSCTADSRGRIVDIDLDRRNPAYGYNSYGYTPYGYRR
jgi:hypothetical protein